MAQCTKTALKLLIVPCSHDWDSCQSFSDHHIASSQSWTSRQQPDDRNGKCSCFVSPTPAPQTGCIEIEAEHPEDDDEHETRDCRFKDRMSCGSFIHLCDTELLKALGPQQ